MNNPILVLNCGSSSIKYALIADDGETRIEGLAESLGNADARIKHKDLDGTKTELAIANGDHSKALSVILSELIKDHHPVAVGHRVVHGGDKFKAATQINDEVLSTIRELSYLAPLHNPANAAGIEAISKIYPNCHKWRFLTPLFIRPCLPKPIATPFQKNCMKTTNCVATAFMVLPMPMCQTVPVA